MSSKPISTSSHHPSPSVTQSSQLSLLPPSFDSSSVPDPTASRPVNNPVDILPASGTPPVPPLRLVNTPNSVTSTPPHSPSTSACSTSRLAPDLSPNTASQVTPQRTRSPTPAEALVTAAKPPRIKPSAMQPSSVNHNKPQSDSVSPVTAAFQMQCASGGHTSMADVKFPLLSSTPSTAGPMPALRPLEEMTDDELRMCLAQANSMDDEEEKKDPNDPEAHVRIWNRRERRKIAGNAAPLRRNVAAYLSTRPDCEIYNNQDKPAGWKPKKKIGKKKRQAHMLMMELQRREQARMEEKRRVRSRAGADGCKACVTQVGKWRGKYCGKYECRVKRHRIDGKLHESLKGPSRSSADEVCCEFDLTESCVTGVTDANMVDWVFKGEEVSGWVAGAVDHEDFAQSRDLPSLSGKFEDIAYSIV